MRRRHSKAQRVIHAERVTARSAQSRQSIKCYVERVDRPDGSPDLRFREKVTKRVVRIVTGQSLYRSFPPLLNLLRDCYSHGGGLVQPRSNAENVTFKGRILRQSQEEVVIDFDDGFGVQVNLALGRVATPPTSVWCYIEEYTGEKDTLGLRLREKETGRKVEMYGTSKEHLTRFLASPHVTDTRDRLPNLYEKHGFRDYVLVSGGTAVDSYDVLLFEDGARLTYLLGPTADTAYRDAFRSMEAESAAETHSRTAVGHFAGGRYREAVLSARLAIEMACGGNGLAVKRRLEGAPDNVRTITEALYLTRHTAVHEGGTRVEQADARRAISSMKEILEFLAISSTQ